MENNFKYQPVTNSVNTPNKNNNKIPKNTSKTPVNPPKNKNLFLKSKTDRSKSSSTSRINKSKTPPKQVINSLDELKKTYFPLTINPKLNTSRPNAHKNSNFIVAHNNKFFNPKNKNSSLHYKEALKNIQEKYEKIQKGIIGSDDYKNYKKLLNQQKRQELLGSLNACSKYFKFIIESNKGITSYKSANIPESLCTKDDNQNSNVKGKLNQPAPLSQDVKKNI